MSRSRPLMPMRYSRKWGRIWDRKVLRGRYTHRPAEEDFLDRYKFVGRNHWRFDDQCRYQREAKR